MGRATKKQIEYATTIANALHKNLPEEQDFDSMNQFIQDNRQSYYNYMNKMTIDTIKSDVSILSMAQELGFTVKRVGKYYTLKEHDSIRIDPAKNHFYRNSLGGETGRASYNGSVIDFVMHFTNQTQASVINELKERVKGNIREIPAAQKTQNVEKGEPGKLELPESSYNMRRVYAYLIKSRGLDTDIVQEFVDRKMLYQDNRGNCVFVSRDENNTPVYACKRGTNTEKRFVADVENCDYEHGFYINNNADKMIVTESVIDAMSVMQVLQAKGLDYHDYNYLPLAGAAKYGCIINQLEAHPATDVYLALDNDEAGIGDSALAAQLIKEHFLDGVEIHDSCRPVYTKDWNEEIQYAWKHQIGCDKLNFFHDDKDDALAKDNSPQKEKSKGISSTYEHEMENDLEV